MPIAKILTILFNFKYNQTIKILKNKSGTVIEKFKLD